MQLKKGRVFSAVYGGLYKNARMFSFNVRYVVVIISIARICSVHCPYRTGEITEDWNSFICYQ